MKQSKLKLSVPKWIARKSGQDYSKNFDLKKKKNYIIRRGK